MSGKGGDGGGARGEKRPGRNQPGERDRGITTVRAGGAAERQLKSVSGLRKKGERLEKKKI